MKLPKGWNDLAETTIGEHVREYHGKACNYLVPMVDEDATREEIETLISEVRDYIFTIQPNVPESAMEKLTFGQVICEGIKRVQSVYTNDPNRWPKGTEWKDFNKAMNVAVEAGDREAFQKLATENPEFWERYDAAEKKRQAMRDAMK